MTTLVFTCLPSPAIATTLPAPAPLPFQEENFLVVGVGLGKYNFPENIEVYQYPGGYLVPLGALSATLDFAIDVTPQEGAASGWFRAEDREFRLNLANHEAVANGNHFTFDPQRLLIQPDDIYVDAALFAEWFGVTLDLDFPNLQLKVSSVEKLPVQLRIEREKGGARVGRIGADESASYPVITPEYHAYNTPFTDILLETKYRTDDSDENNLSNHYTILSQGEAAWLGTSLFLSGNSEDGIGNLRTTAHRQQVVSDPAKPLYPTAWSAGDIYAVTTPLVTLRGFGRGASISNVPVSRANSFNNTDFTGDAPAGWQIELYQNGTLLDFQTVGSDGRYQFLNVPVFYGYNIFRIVSYGPQGQIEEETRPVIIDSTSLKAEELFYQFSIDEKSRSLFGFSEEHQRADHPEGLRTVATIEYGITDGISGSVGYASTPVETDQYDYVMAGLKLAMGGVLFTTDTAYMQQTGGHATQFAATTLIHDIGIRADYTLLSDFFSEQELWEGEFKDHNARVMINGRLQPAFLPIGLSYTFAGQQEAFESGRTTSTLGNQLSTSFGGFILSHTLEAEWRDDPLTAETYTQDGRLSLRYFLGGWFLRLNAEYINEPTQEWQNFTFTTQTYFSRKLSAIAEVRKELLPEEQTIGAISLNKDFDDFRLTGRLQGDDEGEMEIGVSIGFAFGQNGLGREWFMDSLPLASQGAISARAFLDENANGTWDTNELPLPDTQFALRSKTLEHKNGESFLAHAEPYRPTPITVKEASIEEPLWVPKEKGYNVITRPGEVTEIQVPIIPTSEIDGTLYTRLPDGTTQPIGGVTIRLIDEAGHTAISTRTARDGFYLLEKIPPGFYVLHVAAEQLDKRGFKPIPDQQMIMTTESQAYSFMDRVAEAKAPKILPEFN